MPANVHASLVGFTYDSLLADDAIAVSSTPMECFKCSGGDVEVIPLEFWQVEKIQQRQFGVDRISEVRDAFIFQCFTGFAYQDIYDLTPENVVLVGRKKERWLLQTPRKNGGRRDGANLTNYGPPDIKVSRPSLFHGKSQVNSNE